MWIDSAADLQPGDVIAQQFGADFPAIERIEWLDDDRIRLHFVNGATDRTKVSDGRIRLRSRALTKSCSDFKALDAKFGTDPRSPLHHDNRCPEHA